MKGFKTAVGEYKRWTTADWRRYATIMLNLDTHEIWCDCFTSTNEWREYRHIKAVELTNILNTFNMEVNTQNVKFVAIKVLETYALHPKLNAYELEEEVIRCIGN